MGKLAFLRKKEANEFNSQNGISMVHFAYRKGRTTRYAFFVVRSRNLYG